MRITIKEVLLWQVYQKKIKDLTDAIAGQERIINLHIQMDFRHNRKPGDYSKLYSIMHNLQRKKYILLGKFNKIDEKVEKIAEET